MAHLERPSIALGFSFDGVDDRIDLGNVLNMGTSDFSIEALAFPESNVGNVFVSKQYDWYPGRVGYTFAIKDAKLFLSISDGVTGYERSGATPIETTKWHHCVVVVDRVKEVATFYHDGVFDAEVAIPGVGSIDNPQPLCVGVTAKWHWFLGVIALTRIYNRVLSSAEVSDLYSIKRNIMEGCVLKLGSIGLVRGGGTKWLDEGPYKYHGTVYGAKRVRCCHCNVVRDYGA